MMIFKHLQKVVVYYQLIYRLPSDFDLDLEADTYPVYNICCDL